MNADALHRCVTAFVLVIAANAMRSAPASAEIEREIHIDSLPTGAKVFMIRGRRETLLGETPLTYRASFRSEKTTIRLLVRRPGYEEETLTISTADSEVKAKLVAFHYAASPEEQDDPVLRDLQANVNPIISGLLPGLADLPGPFEYNMAGKAEVVRDAGDTYLLVPLAVVNLGERLSSRGKERQNEMVRLLWSQFGKGLVEPLAQELKTGSGLSGIRLSVYFDEKRYLFDVSSHLETRSEMQCRGGYVQRSVYNPCARQKTQVYTDASGHTWTRDAGCEAGYSTQSVFEPCASKVPVTRTHRVLDPAAAVAPGNAKITYTLPRDLFDSRDLPLSRIEYVLQDASGKVIDLQDGRLP